MMYAGHCRQFDADVQYDVQLQTHRPSDAFSSTERPRLLHAVSNVQPSGIIVGAGIGVGADVVGCCIVVAGGDAVSGVEAVGASVVAMGTAVGFMLAGFIVGGLILAGDGDGDPDSDTDVESDVVSDAESSSEAKDDSEAVNVYVAVAVSVPGVALVE